MLPRRRWGSMKQCIQLRQMSELALEPHFNTKSGLRAKGRTSWKPETPQAQSVECHRNKPERPKAGFSLFISCSQINPKQRLIEGRGHQYPQAGHCIEVRCGYRQLCAHSHLCKGQAAKTHHQRGRHSVPRPMALAKLVELGRSEALQLGVLP